MRIAIVGASGKTGMALVQEGLDRGHEVVGVCRPSTAERLGAFVGHEHLTVRTAPIVSDEAALSKALVGCDAVVSIVISVKDLKATDLVGSLAKVGKTHGVKRFVFTAGEITAVREPGEKFTLRQKIMSTVIPPLMRVTPFSLTDMLDASRLIREQPEWSWTIIRAPSLTQGEPLGYRLGKLSEVKGAHKLPRKDYAACMLDSISNPDHHRRTLTVLPSED
jgi:putative NADH-flavin reductase